MYRRAELGLRSTKFLFFICKVQAKKDDIQFPFSSRVPEDPGFKFRDLNYYCLLFQFFVQTIPGSGTSIT